MREKASTAGKGRKARPTSERRARKAAVLRQRLIDCALSLFEKHSFIRTSIDSITEAADVGKGTFYNYFDTKEALLAAWGRQILAQAWQEVAVERPDEPAMRRLFRLFSALLEPVQERPRLASPFVMAFLMMAGEARPGRGGAKDGAPQEGETPATLLAAVLPIVRGAVVQKALRSDPDPERVAKAILGLFYQSVMLLATGEERESPRELLRSALALGLEGLAPAVE